MGRSHFLDGMAAEIDLVWSRDYQRLQADISAWQPRVVRGHTSALHQTYQAFVAGGHEIEGAIYVLEAPVLRMQQELIQASGCSTPPRPSSRTTEPEGAPGWHRLQTNSVDRRFAATVNRRSPSSSRTCTPVVGNVAFAGASFAPGLHYLADLNAS